MSDLLARTLPLALGAAISPLVLMGALSVLGGHRGKARLAAYTIGFAVTSTVLLALGLVLVTLQRHHGAGNPVGSPVAEFIVGVLLIAFAAFMVRPKRESDDTRAKEKHRRWVTPESPLYAFAIFGVVMMLIDFSSIVLLLAILKELARHDATIGQEVVVLAIADVCTMLPALLPLLAAVLGGERLAGDVQRLGQWTNRNGRYILAVLFLVFGLQDILKAFGH